MKNRKCSILTLMLTGFGILFCSVYGTIAEADILHESATLGTTGLAVWGTAAGRVNDSPLDRTYYGSIFHIDSGICWEVTAIGGHFCRFRDRNGTLFGAIMKLDSSEVLPVDPPLDFSDVVASTVFVPDYPSSDYRTPLSVTLEPGDYALVFGSDDLGASDGGMAVMHQPGHENLSGEYPIYAYTSQGWYHNYSTGAREARFVVEGTVIPVMVVGLEIIGPNEVAENFQTRYAAIAHYDNNSTEDVTELADWSVEPDTAASINASGLLTTGDVESFENVTISAEYTEDEIRVAAEKTVTIFAICPGGSALSFDGVDDYVEIPDDDSLTPEDQITVSFWTYRTVGGGATINKYAKCPSESASPGNSRAYTIIISGETNKVSAYIASSVNNVDSLKSNNIIPPNEWHYITVTFNHGDAAIYIDGQLDISKTMSVTSIMNDHHPLTIGAFWSYCGVDHLSTLMHGQIDEVSIYNRALSAEEIRANMHTRLSGDEPGLVGYWDFDEGEGQITYDLSGNGNDGQLGSTPNPDNSDPAWVESDAPIGICNNVAFDIKPGSCPNPLNLKSKGVLPAAILGTEEFDVNTIDVASVRLAGVAAIRHSYEDVAGLASDANECECTEEGPDGYTDLTLKFRTQEIVEQLIDTPGGLVNGQTLGLNLSGVLFDDRAIAGSDCVVLVGNVPRWLSAKKWDGNEDGVVNLFDLAEMAQYWLESSVVTD